MPTLRFSTKGRTLKALSPALTGGKVLPVFLFRVRDLRRDSGWVIKKVREYFRKEKLLVVRSSAGNEDSQQSSGAGVYTSVLNVPCGDEKKLLSAINRVIDSYPAPCDQEEVLVQPALSGIKIAGVVFTADLDTLAPYYIINYSESGSTDAVTSGRDADTKTFVHFKNAPFPARHPLLARLCAVCREMEKLFASPNLDVEFAFDSFGTLFILQVRPIVVKNKEDLSGTDLSGALEKIYRKVERSTSTHPNLLGDRTIYGVMPDWNPAEMIGLKPKRMAISLYKELITDSVWAYQRDNYGYRNLRSHPLLLSFLGMPFIDLRVDFNSFIPKALDKTIADKLVRFYLAQLVGTPANHDKVEFRIVHSCYYLNLPEKLKALLSHGFNVNEITRIEFALLEITNNIIDPVHGLYKSDLQKIETLKDNYAAITGSDLPVIEKIYWLVEDCKRYGTLPFAGIARAAFIAVQLLKSFLEMGIITHKDYDRFMNSLNTVAKQLNADLRRLSKGSLPARKFLSVYGHLRPGTYDILSPRYDESFGRYFSRPALASGWKYQEPAGFSFSKKQIKRLNVELMEHGIRADAESMLRFIKESIEGREYAKFVFTKSVSEILRLVEGLGEKHRISKEELAHLDIKTVLSQYSSFEPGDVKSALRADLDRNRESYKYTTAVKLPALIKDAGDVYSFFVGKEEPTFVTLKRVSAATAAGSEIRDGELEGKIVLIPSADPGYDFLFTKNIAGLITQFGGANSHMAVRCAELGVPAVIGAGEKNFSDWSRARMLVIDCQNKIVESDERNSNNATLV